MLINIDYDSKEFAIISTQDPQNETHAISVDQLKLLVEIINDYAWQLNRKHLARELDDFGDLIYPFNPSGQRFHSS